MSTKERPILFSGALVRAIFDGTKTQTRRLVRDAEYQSAGYGGVISAESIAATKRCPFGAPGDRLWVRESFRARYFDNGAPAFAADWTGESADCVPEPKWTPSIHMPRALSRIDLEVTAVRVERLQDITEEDAKAEGVQRGDLAIFSSFWIGAFAELWEAINGERAAWGSNPWVWAIDFRRVRP